MSFPALAFATPRKLPKAKDLAGRVVVLDVAFASEASGGGFEKITLPLIRGLGPRLAVWIDHHDHVMHANFADDPRFVLRTKAQHGACPEMVTPDLVERVGPIDTILCHTDFDGLCSAAKWIRGGREPYPNADEDARAIDTRIGTPSPLAQRFDAALRARPRDNALFGIIVRHLATGLGDPSLWTPIDEAAAEGQARDALARDLARGYVTLDLHDRSGRLPNRLVRGKSLAFVNVTGTPGAYDKTTLLLLGQERASLAAVVDRDTVTFAAPFDSGVNFLELFGLSGGMPTLVSLGASRLEEVLGTLGVAVADQKRILP